MPGEETQQFVSFREKIPDNYCGSRSTYTVLPPKNEKHAKAHHYLTAQTEGFLTASLYSIHVKMKKTGSEKKNQTLKKNSAEKSNHVDDF